MEKRKHVSFILPDYLMEPFYEEIERINESNHPNAKTQLMIKSLSKYLKVEIPKPQAKKLRTSNPITRRAINVEDLASRMEMNKNYNITDLMNITGISRTTVRNLIEDNHDWFATDGPWREKFYLKKEVKRPEETQERKKKRRKKKTTDKPNVEAVSVSGPKREPGLLNMEEWDRVTELYEQGKIHHDESQSYTMRYYEENPEIWNDSYEDLEERTMLLNMREKTIKKVTKLLKA